VGDMPPTSSPAAPAVGLGPALAEAVKRFQRRHGLTADGVIGPATAAALEVPLAHRVRQIEFAMERLRWLPPPQGRPVVAINIPMFRLWAYAPQDRGGPRDMAVIVGRALRTRTPVLMHDMRQVIFRPYWNVPPSILRNEILPRLRRDPGYLQRNDMEIVRGAGDDAPHVAVTPANLELLAQGALRLRQRPGPRNSLGLVKFVLPNDENIYLHDTPATELFQRARRDFSHGCVRVEAPVALAQWVLADQPMWTRERIVEAMHGMKTVAVDLATPVQVVIYYMTAMVLPGDEGLAFAQDIYGHDAALEAALAAGRAP
jgi:L,D-transpeptidase YcbB